MTEEEEEKSTVVCSVGGKGESEEAVHRKPSGEERERERGDCGGRGEHKFWGKRQAAASLLGLGEVR